MKCMQQVRIEMELMDFWKKVEESKQGLEVHLRDFWKKVGERRQQCEGKEAELQQEAWEPEHEQ